MAHMRQSRPDSGLGFQVKVLRTIQVVAASLGSGKGISQSNRISNLIRTCIHREYDSHEEFEPFLHQSGEKLQCPTEEQCS